MSLIFVDCEAYGGSPVTGRLTEFGAVDYDTLQTFHGVILQSEPSEENPAVPRVSDMPQDEYDMRAAVVFGMFSAWLKVHTKGRPIFVSDNPAFDWQWINCGFWNYMGGNPFGHSARRIGDYYAGLIGNFYKTQDWKRFRVTTHDHNPVNDAMGNVEAFKSLQAGKR